MKNKKLIITITALCLVVVAVVATVVGVLAATSQKVNSSVQASYTANNVNASVTSSVKLQNATSYAGSGSAVTFNLTEKQTSKAVGATNQVLLGEHTDHVKFNRYAIIKYTFENRKPDTASQKILNVSTTWDLTKATATNCKVFFMTSASDPAAPDVSAAGETTFPATLTGWSTSAPSTIKIAAQATQSIYMLVAIIDATQNASFSAGSTALKFTLTATAS